MWAKCIERDLSVPAERIGVLGLPADGALARRVLDRGPRLQGTRTPLYVGRFAPHKNLRRLVRAFGRSDFAADGGRLLTVGGADAEVTDLFRQLSAAETALVELRTPSSQDDLETLLATCLFLVQPSLEEAFRALGLGSPHLRSARLHKRRWLTSRGDAGIRGSVPSNLDRRHGPGH